ncbi:MAG: thioredoxin domain-containing protein [Flavobacteriales bacterium]|nr:MAG: thioredoxin domain-containing protein [Flavobacteriales bacterium]
MKKVIFSFLLLIIIINSCNEKDPSMSNNLINETSPYLLQHAYNPVNWNPWNKKYLEQAKKEDKLVIISIGYSSCHWCHVMERESFEDSLVASIMNEKFISIKVDREERPDVDQVYMNAVQLMTGSGGWPLNVVTLPDGRPIWGGTYFSKDQWINALTQISNIYKKEPERFINYANTLEKGIKSLDVINTNENKTVVSSKELEKYVENIASKIDKEHGGFSGAPKFMMPNNIHLLLRTGHQNNDKAVLDLVNLTLEKMAYGGIYDQIGGGFSRYSTDEKWHIPHFEKMLYDNAQLISLYSDAYLITKNELYKNVVYETINFVLQELTDSNGGFYSSIDADSKSFDGEEKEGAYYIWKENELKNLLKDEFILFSEYYNINKYGYWEDENYVLIKNQSDLKFSKEFNLSKEDLIKKKDIWKGVLTRERNKRTRPNIDDKILASWNGLMINGLVDAYRVFKEDKFLDAANLCAEFILENMQKSDGGLHHSHKDGISKINGYLEDYSAVIKALLNLYENTLNEKWLNTADNLMKYSYENFYNPETKMFFFTSKLDDKLISRTVEFRDNVIPSSNSIMANNLFKLSHYYDNSKYLNTSLSMVKNISDQIDVYPNGFSNWMNLILNLNKNFYEIAIVGDSAIEKINELNKNYLPNKIVVGSLKDNSLPLLKNRYIEGETMIYVCVKKACKMPVKTIKEALELID